MLPELTATAATFAFNDRSLDGLVKEFSPADWAVQDAAGHSPRWIMGHLATYRHRVLAQMGAPVPAAPWEDCFTRGRSSADVPADLDMAPVVAAFHAALAAMAERWEALTPEDLAQPVGRRLPDGSEDTGGLIRFLAWHETYHLGQLGLLRRLVGRTGIA